MPLRRTRTQNTGSDTSEGLRKSPYDTIGTGDETVSIDQNIRDLPTYEIAPEAEQRLRLLQATGADMNESASEATGIARMRSGAYETPGSVQAMGDIRGDTSAQIGALRQMGGPGFAGAVSRVGLGEQEAIRGLAQAKQDYKSRAKESLIDSVKTEAGIKSQASQLEAQGLEGMVSEKDKVYQSELDKMLTFTQWRITKERMDQDKEQAKKDNIMNSISAFANVLG